MDCTCSGPSQKVGTEPGLEAGGEGAAEAEPLFAEDLPSLVLEDGCNGRTLLLIEDGGREFSLLLATVGPSITNNRAILPSNDLAIYSLF